MWIPLNILQEMRVWVLLGGRKNKLIHSFLSSDLEFVSLNIPIYDDWYLPVETIHSVPDTPDPMLNYQVDSLSILSNTIAYLWTTVVSSVILAVAWLILKFIACFWRFETLVKLK